MFCGKLRKTDVVIWWFLRTRANLMKTPKGFSVLRQKNKLLKKKKKRRLKCIPFFLHYANGKIKALFSSGKYNFLNIRFDF